MAFVSACFVLDRDFFPNGSFLKRHVFQNFRISGMEGYAKFQAWKAMQNF